MCQSTAQSQQFQYHAVDSGAAGTVDQWFKVGIVCVWGGGVLGVLPSNTESQNNNRWGGQ